MYIAPVNKIPLHSRLGQNIYRHDGLLALPRGIIIRQRELDELKYHGIDYVLVYDRFAPIGNENDISFTLNILENSYLKTTLWDEEFGRVLYEYIHKRVIHNSKVSKLLNELRIADSYSFAHCINISMIVVSLLVKEKVNIDVLCNISYISLLHDVGRLKMLSLFNKQGKLNEDEYEQIKMHPKESFKMLKKAGLLEEEITFVMETHEKFNGTGYPYMLSGEDISDLGQLILIADVYNALSSFRPYRDVFTPHEVSKMIEEDKGKSFNENVVRLFKKNFEPYKKGMRVELDDGRLAAIRDTRYSKTLPVVEVIDIDTGNVEELIDLSSKSEIRIKRILDI